MTKKERGEIFTFETTFDGELPQEGIQLPTREMELALMYTKIKVTIEILDVIED